MRRPLKIALTITAGFVGVLVVAGLALFVAGNTVAGRRILERAIRDLSAGRVELVGLQGNFPAHLTLARLTLSDRQGVWLSADRVVLDWRPLSLFERVVRVEDLRAARVVLTRLPAPAPGPHRPPASIPRIDVAHAQIEKLELGSQLAGHPAVLAVHGSVRLRSLEDLLARVDAVRLDAAGRYALRFAVDPLRVDARLSIQEPAGGPLENLLGLPDLDGIAATLLLQGPRTAERLDLRVQAGALRARAQGSVNLAARSAKIAYSVEAGAMSPRPGVGWQSVAASGQWRGGLDDEVADSKLDIRHLRLGKVATIAELQATLTGRAGLLGVQGEVSGLIPAGVPASVLAHDPISFEARYSPKDPSHQLHLHLEQPLFSLRGQIATRAPFAVVLNLDVPQIATFAALVKQSLRGHAAIRLELGRQAGREHFTLAASIAGFGGAAPWATAFGSSAKLQAQGSVGARHIDLPQLRISGRRWSVTGAGKALRRTSGSGALESLRAHWRLDAPDLSAFSPMLAGRLSGAGQIAGPPDALAGSGSLWVGGSFEAAPLRLALDWRRAGDGVVSAVIRRGTWKSVRLSGDFALDRAFAWTHGRFSAKIGDLADLDAITGGTLHGTLQADATVGRLAGRLDLNLHAVTHDAAIDRLAADVEAWASGPPDALKVRLAARMPPLGGAAASAASTGMLNLARRQLHIATFTLDYRDRVARLLAPADLTYGGGISTAAARLSIGGATLAFAGRIAPNLKLSASLEGAAAPLVDLFAPGLLAHGRIAAKASFQGRLAAPTGELRWSASGMRSAAAEALGLPAVDFDGKARLDGDSAQVEAQVHAGAKSRFSVAGRVPLRAGVPFDLKSNGTVDLGIAAPTLEARGIYLAGILHVAVAVSGDAQAPRIAGTVSLSGGHLRDYVRGINLENIDAQLVGDGNALAIKRFTASMPPGTVSMTGRIGFLRSGIPLDLHIVAKNARPITSSLVTANMDADLHVRGTARRRIELSGTIHVNHAVVGIPKALPPNVAVLNVRRPGQAAVKAVKPIIVTLHLDVSAPRQVFVRGRGLDAELGGDLRLAGTVDAPEVGGGFNLQRGSVELAGSRLSFTSGRVGFNGAGLRHRIDPTIDFSAQTNAGGVQATLRITGLADAPRFALTSIPSMPPDEILRVLLFGGSNPTHLSALQAAQIGAAFATLSGVGGGEFDPLAKLQRTLGLDRLTVGAAPTNGSPTSGSSASGASIAAGRYLSPRVYIEAKQTTTGSSQLLVNVDLTKHLKLQTRLGTGAVITPGTTPLNDPGNSIGLSYQIEY